MDARDAAVLRIVFITGSLAHGGAERHAIALVNGLTARGHECHLVHVKSLAEQGSRLAAQAGGRVHDLGAARYFDLAALRRLAALLAQLRPNVVVAANGYALLYASLARVLGRCTAPLAVSFHSTRIRGAKEQLQMALYRPLFWAAACTVFVCEAQRRFWKWRAVASRKVRVILNGVDADAFRDRWSGAQRRQLRARLGFGDGDYVVGLLAVLRPEKNPLQLVDAIAALRHAGIPAHALIVGDGPLRRPVLARARALGIGAEVVITGMQQEVRPFLCCCDAVALCSLTEAFPLAALEAMAMGRPVVLSQVGGATELVEPDRSGLLFPVGDTPALVRALRRLADRRYAALMGREARCRAEKHLSERAMLDRYEALLAELAGWQARTGVRPDHARLAQATSTAATIGLRAHCGERVHDR